MPYLAALDLRGRRCLVAGGGAVARRKAAGLLAAGASVHVVAPHVEGMPADVVVERRAALPGDLEGVTLLVCATDDPQVNAVLATEAHRRGVLVNVVDDPGSGSFTVPAVLRRGRLQVGVSTGGASPSLAARIRDELAVVVDEPYGELVALLGELRAEWEPRADAAGLPPDARRAAWRAVLELPLLELLRQGDGCEARVRAEGVLEDALGSAG
ncbi:MAG TPA: bifunctional precorrin-2 dehydrogenase/sirohydrochlorin ferrochelatase [Thermoleophilia bacterium]|nr:bifunctional precorrin-2 dehydrogenase/sirohydrochlorin ferrochelatase [Thermoleophilia bacterium]